MTQVAKALGVSTSNLLQRVKAEPVKRDTYDKPEDAALVKYALAVAPNGGETPSRRSSTIEKRTTRRNRAAAGRVSRPFGAMTSAYDAQDEEDLNNFERNGWDDREVNRQRLMHVVMQEGSPSLLRTRKRILLGHVPLDGGFGDYDPELKKLSVDTRGSPTHI